MSDLLIQRCDRAMFLSFLLIILFMSVSTALVEVGTVGCLLAFLFKRKALASRQRDEQKTAGRSFWQRARDTGILFKPVNHPLVVPATLFLAAVFLSVVFSHFPYFSWKGFIGKTLQSTVLFFLAVETFNSRKRINTALSVFVVAVLLTALDGFIQKIFGKDLVFFREITSDGRISGPFTHPNDLAGYMVFTAVFLVGMIALIWQSRKSEHMQGELGGSWGTPFQKLFFLTIGTAASLMTLGWTFSRGAWIGLTAGVLGLILLDRRRWWLKIALLVLFWGVFLAQLSDVRNVSFFSDDLATEARLRAERRALDSARYAGMSQIEIYFDDFKFMLSRFGGMGRQAFWSESLELFSRSPIVGTGVNTFTRAAKEYIPDWTGYYSHNCYLQMLAELGVVGLGAFLWVMFVLSREVWRGARLITNEYDRTLMIALFSAILAFWVHSIFDTNFYSAKLGNMMWIFMGMTVAVLLVSRKEAR